MENAEDFFLGGIGILFHRLEILTCLVELFAEVDVLRDKFLDPVSLVHLQQHLHLIPFFDERVALLPKLGDHLF